MSCRYTTPFTSTGGAEYPSVSPMALASPVDSIGTHQATLSWATFEAVIALATSRVFCMSPPGSVQAAATPGLAELAGAVLAAPACLPEQLGALACGVLPEQPATARPAAASTVTPATPVRVTKHLIWLLSHAGCGRPSQPAA